MSLKEPIIPSEKALRFAASLLGVSYEQALKITLRNAQTEYLRRVDVIANEMSRSLPLSKNSDHPDETTKSRRPVR